MKKLLIISPIHNEGSILEVQVKKVLDWCELNLKGYDWTYAVLDNASTDTDLSFQRRRESKGMTRSRTSRFVSSLCDDSSKFRDEKKFKYYKLHEKGRGKALKWAWKNLKFDSSLYMDIDLATDLKAITQVLIELEQGVDLVVGSRWLKQSVVSDRKLQRTILSYGYKNLVQLMTASKISDFQCGFKAVRRDFIKNIIQNLNDEQWFFDTELILTAEKLGYKVKDIPINWCDDPSSKVKIFKDSWLMFKSLLNYINTP